MVGVKSVFNWDDRIKHRILINHLIICQKSISWPWVQEVLPKDLKVRDRFLLRLALILLVVLLLVKRVRVHTVSDYSELFDLNGNFKINFVNLGFGWLFWVWAYQMPEVQKLSYIGIKMMYKERLLIGGGCGGNDRTCWRGSGRL